MRSIASGEKLGSLHDYPAQTRGQLRMGGRRSQPLYKQTIICVITFFCAALRRFWT
jgi:hypothetical protein